MDKLGLLNQVQDAAEQAAQKAEEVSGFLGPVRQYIVDNFGQSGLMAAYLVVAVLVLVLISKLVGVGLSALKYLVIPAVALAFVASLFLPFSFITALPVTATVCSLFMLFKG
jgi:hypothetical protein